MTPANAVSAPAAVIPVTSAQKHPTAAKSLAVLNGELIENEAFIEGALALLDQSEFTDRDPTLGNAQTLLRQCIIRNRQIYDSLEFASLDEGARPFETPHHSAMAHFGEQVCERAGLVKGLIDSAVALMRKDDNDQEHTEIWQAGDVLQHAAKLANELAGYATDVTRENA